MQKTFFINLNDKFECRVILWAIDVPHMPLQRDAIMRIGANPQNRIKYGL